YVRNPLDYAARSRTLMMERTLRWLTIFATIIATCTSAVVLAVAFIYSGVYDVAATVPHWSLMNSALNTACTRSIKTHAENIQVPCWLDDESAVLTGVGHFAAHCAVCHGAPGVPKGEIAEGMTPKPPDLAAITYSSAELFWILKNGIKMTGMPSWGDHS